MPRKKYETLTQGQWEAAWGKEIDRRLASYHAGKSLRHDLGAFLDERTARAFAALLAELRTLERTARADVQEAISASADEWATLSAEANGIRAAIAVVKRHARNARKRNIAAAISHLGDEARAAHRAKRKGLAR